MNKDIQTLCQKLIPKGYVERGTQARETHEKLIRHLMEQRKWPDRGWDAITIELLLKELSVMDSSNFLDSVGVGEREGRIYSSIVQDRHFGYVHGIGRSGDITAIQPKAAGSSLLMKLTNSMVLDSLQKLGAPHATKDCFVVPVATGMALVLCMLTIRQMRPKAKYVIWPRIDQKSCFKSIITAGYYPVIIENIYEGDELRTGLMEIKDKIKELGKENIACIMTTTSCFAPRVPDKLVAIAEICYQNEIPHVVNNAYGVQSFKCMNLLEQAAAGNGRLDVYVQSTDKNYLVPVGGAIIAGPDPDFIEKIAQNYPGRASGTPTLDLFITLLHMGSEGYSELKKQREDVFTYFKPKLYDLAKKYGERLLDTPHNPISMAITLKAFDDHKVDPNIVGSMLFVRNITGARVVRKPKPNDEKEIAGWKFPGYGSHICVPGCSYLNVAVAIGLTKGEADQFLVKLEKVMSKEYEKLRRDSDTDTDEYDESTCSFKTI